MPRTYKPKNRYCRNTKLSEEEFEMLVHLFVGGMAASAIASKIRRSERSVRDMLSRLRERYCDDAELTGWMGGGQMPPADDPVWGAMYDCLICCPAATDGQTHSTPEYVLRFRGRAPHDDDVPNRLSFTTQKRSKTCSDCPIGLRFKFDGQVFKELAAHSLKVGGIPRDRFRGHYFEAMLRINTRYPSTKFPESGRSIDAARVLERLAAEPLQ